MDQGRRRQTRRPALRENDRRGSARSADVRNSCDHRRARRPPASSNPSGASPPFRRRCHPPPEPERVPTRNDEPSASSARTNRNRSRRPQRERNTTNVSDRRGAFLTTTDPLVSTPSTPWWRHASRDRTHRSARDWQRYVVGKVLLSSETARDPDAGAGVVAIIKIAGARAGELATRPTIERGGRLKSFLVRIHRLQPPAMRVGLWPTLVNTKCVRDCVRCFWRTSGASLRTCGNGRSRP